MELGSRRFFGGCYNQDISKDPKKRHDYVSVLYNKDIYLYYFCFSRFFLLKRRT